MAIKYKLMEHSKVYCVVFTSGYKCRTYAIPEQVTDKAKELCEKYAKYYIVSHKVAEVICEN
jgi:hypothetical protein